MGRAGAWAAERALFLFGRFRSCCCRCSMSSPASCGAMRGGGRNAEPQTSAGGARWACCCFAMALLATVFRSAFTEPGGRCPPRWAALPACSARRRSQALAGAACPKRRRAGRSSASRWSASAAGAVLVGAGLRDRLGALADAARAGFAARAARCPARRSCHSQPARRREGARAPAPSPCRRDARASRPKSSIPTRPPSPAQLSVRQPRRRTCSTTTSCPASTCSPIRPPTRSAQDRQAGAGAQCAAARNRARRFQRQGRDHRGAHRPGRHDVRAGARARHQGQPRDRPGRRHRPQHVRDFGARLADSRPHRDGHRTAQCRPPDGRASRSWSPARPSPITRRMLPIILGKNIAGEPVIADLAADAAPAGRRHHRLGQVGRAQLHDPVAALPADARSSAA